MKTQQRLGLTLVAGLASALAIGGLAPATAHQGRAHRPIGFTGDCHLSGTVRFKPPLTNTPRPLEQHARGTGTCSGTVLDRNGRAHELSGERVVYIATERGDEVSCGLGIDAGKGRLRFRWGALRFAVSEKRVAAVATLSLAGANGGSATGIATASGDPATAVEQCAGSGIRRTSADLSISAPSGISG